MVKDYNLVVKAVAKNLNMSEYEVWRVVRSVCRHIKFLIESGENTGFYMMFLGKFYVKSKRIEQREEKIRSYKEKEKDV